METSLIWSVMLNKIQHVLFSTLNFPGIFTPEMFEKWKHVLQFGKFVFCIILRAQCPADSLVLVSGIWNFLSASASVLLTLQRQQLLQPWSSTWVKDLMWPSTRLVRLWGFMIVFALEPLVLREKKVHLS